MSGIREHKGNLLLKTKPRPEGYSKLVGRGEMGLKHLEFGLLRLSSGARSGKTGKCEQALDILSGVVEIEAGGRPLGRLGGRKDIFSGAPSLIYLPPKTPYRIAVVEGPVEIAVFSASAPDFEGEPAVAGPAIGEEFSAGKLLVGEASILPGRWSDFPPRKHDAFAPPNEVPLEEVLYFRVKPSRGFGIVRVYTHRNDPGPMDEVHVIEDGDTVVIARGYHTIAAAPGCALAYTWAMAGEIRRLCPGSPDPRYSLPG